MSELTQNMFLNFLEGLSWRTGSNDRSNSDGIRTMLKNNILSLLDRRRPKMSQEEPFPVHETVKVLQGITIKKNSKWWSAALVTESYGKRQISLYLWLKSDDGKWKRKEKFIIPSKENWETLKKAVDEKLFSLYVR